LQVDFENLFGFDVSSSAVFGDSDQQNTYTLKSLMRLCNLHKTGGQPLTPNTFPIRLTFDRDASVPVINFTPIVNETTGHLYFFPREQQEVIYRLGVSPEALWYIDPVKNTDAFADANVGSEEDEATASGAPAQPQPQQQPQAQAQPQTQRHVVPTPGQAQVVMPAAAPQPSQQYTQPPAAQFTVQATPAPAPQPAPQPMQGQILMPPPPADVPVQQPAAVFGGANQGVVRAAAPQVAQPMPQPVALQVAQHISPQLVAPQAAPAKRTRKSNTKKATPEPATVVEGYDVPQSYTDQLVNDFGEFSEDDII
jgi:hypothetical protein